MSASLQGLDVEVAKMHGPMKVRLATSATMAGTARPDRQRRDTRRFVTALRRRLKRHRAPCGDYWRAIRSPCTGRNRKAS